MHLICGKMHDFPGREGDGVFAAAEAEFPTQYLHGDWVGGLVIRKALAWCKAEEDEVSSCCAQDALYAGAGALWIGIWC